jgi:hypothetical protein
MGFPHCEPLPFASGMHRPQTVRPEPGPPLRLATRSIGIATYATYATDDASSNVGSAEQGVESGSG